MNLTYYFSRESEMGRTSFQGLLTPEPELLSFDIQEMAAPSKVVISMLQQPQEALSPTVRVGDQVKKGQIIGEGSSSASAPIHASVSGKVVEIGKRLEPSGMTVDAVIIESDGKNEWIPGVARGDSSPMVGMGIMSKTLMRAGIVEASAPSFSLSSRMAPRPVRDEAESAQKGAPVKFLVINAVDIEPGVTVRRAALKNKYAEIVEGSKTLRKAVGVQRVLLAVNDESWVSDEAIDAFKREDIELFWASRKYPSGMEPILIKQITGKEIPLPGGISLDAGALLVDTLTVLNVLDAVRESKPQVEKLVTVSAPGMGIAANVLVPIGTTLRDLFESLAIDPAVGKVLVGGSMMGTAQYSLDVPITKQTYAVTIQTPEEVSEFLPEACIDCGACVTVCPTNLMANLLGRYCEYRKFEIAERAFLFHCIECGNCAYVCPTKRPMVQFMKLGKKELMGKRTGA